MRNPNSSLLRPAAVRPAGAGLARCWWVAWTLLLAAPLATQAGSTVMLAAATPAVVTEYEVKAAYLLRFTRYIEWPAASFASPESPIVIGVLGRNPFGDALERTVRGMKSQGRDVTVRLLGGIKEAGGCHMVFIGRGQERDEAAWLAVLRNQPVVTITDSADGLARGAILALFVEELPTGARVAFAASLPAAQAAGVQLSAAMLPSARKVIRAEPEQKGHP